ncbi:MAG: radical SAM protein, partial [Candidatus Margulisbacteria bacterium]|nr:radical SAM protein [Candidatus Margulisiibacteriota bacterium]
MKTINFYVTLRCDDTCEFCQCWQNSEYQDIGESGDQGKVALKELRIKGAKVLNITGGEPLLREDLADILRYAKQIGYQIELTTNGILYRERGGLIGGLVDRLFISLDYPIASEHDRSRGVECFTEVIAAIKQAKEKGEKPIIKFTMTRDSVRFLPEMSDLADKLGVRLYLNPVYDFNGTQGFEPMTIEHIKYYGRKKNVIVNLAALEFIRSGGNKVMYPRCRANETTVTLLPNGSRVAPCFFNPNGRQGQEDVCSSCMRWPYMLPSFSVGFDKYRWL